ncbi:MAG TPA: RtcB family protein, partial [Salinivirgaceae bacterium]|nr:RtcB family protein [Salinivirgaceae bacterium]
KIRNLIPVGHTWHKKPQDKKRMPQGIPQGKVVKEEFENALHQIGTLGSGNHFIEIQKGSDGFIWIMIHSGSRNLGKKVAEYYNRLAIEKNKAHLNKNNRQLAHLWVDSQEGREYIDEMNFCVAFAFENRKLMMERIIDVFEQAFPNIEIQNFINIAHNFAALEYHFGKDVWVHRKGATRARLGEWGIIPGSQGATSFIVMGLGNPMSFESCSHGAGRKMGRNQAIETLDFNKEVEHLEKQGILHSIRTRRDLEEAAGAYKDINRVMQNQADLIKPIIELHPMAVIKG